MDNVQDFIDDGQRIIEEGYAFLAAFELNQVFHPASQEKLNDPAFTDFTDEELKVLKN